jgi:hypothetical protein
MARCLSWYKNVKLVRKRVERIQRALKERKSLTRS